MTPTSKELIKQIEKRNHRLKVAWAVFLALAIILLAGSLYLGYQANKANQAILKNQSKVLESLQAQSKKRDTNLNKLLTDNAQQTVILCTVIINTSADLNSEEVAQVEEICKQRIAQSNQPSATPAPATSQASPSSPTATPGQGGTPQPSSTPPKSEPPKSQGIIPDRIPLIGPLL